MHTAARNFVRSIAPLIRGSVCEIGSRNVNGSVRYLFHGCQYVGVDIREGPGVDIVADGSRWDGDGQLFDAVVCCEMLEHAEWQAEMCCNIMDLLRPGGVAIITVAGPGREPHSGIDGGPLQDGEHYRNVEAAELKQWFSGYSVIAIDDRCKGDLYCMVVK